MSQAVAIEPAAIVAAPRPRAAFAGAGLLSIAMVGSGGLAYAFHVLAARTLGPEAYGQIAVLWGALFLVTVVLFRPLEQTVARSLAARLALNEEGSPVVRAALGLFGAMIVACSVAAAIAWQPITDRLFLGNEVMTAMLVFGVVVYGVSYLVRGAAAGTCWFHGYALALLGDGVMRILIAVPLIVLASQNLAAAAVGIAAIAAVVVPVAAGRRRIAPLLRKQERGDFRLTAALAFAAPASVIAIADQLLVNGAPVLVMLEGGPDANRAAGVVFAATMLVRVPVYVFQGISASLLPNLTRMHTEEHDGFNHAVARTAASLLGVGALIVAATAAVGPEAMRLLFGDGFEASRGELTLLGAGVGCYLAAATFSQALLALHNGVRAACAWSAAAAVFVASYLVLPGEPLARVSGSFALATLLSLVLLAGALFQRLRAA